MKHFSELSSELKKVDAQQLKIGVISISTYLNDISAFLIAIGENKSAAYKKLSANIERVCEWLYFALVATLIAIVMFPICFTGFNYFILDLGVESFYLYPPTAFVSLYFWNRSQMKMSKRKCY